MTNNEFRAYAQKHAGISSLAMHRYESILSEYITPNIIEERQLNAVTMDVFSRLMMDRIAPRVKAIIAVNGDYYAGDASNKSLIVRNGVVYRNSMVRDWREACVLYRDGRMEVFRNRELMEKASILPPQMIALSIHLGEGFEQADSPESVADAVLALRKGGARHE